MAAPGIGLHEPSELVPRVVEPSRLDQGQIRKHGGLAIECHLQDERLVGRLAGRFLVELGRLRKLAGRLAGLGELKWLRSGRHSESTRSGRWAPRSGWCRP